MDFKYAPGLPGYGTRGVDGSVGLAGSGMFFTDIDGLTNTAAITAKINNNEVLTTGNTDKIPGYPERVYQTGDTILDINSKLFEIDLDIAARINYTGTGLNTSSEFEFGADQPEVPSFKRKHNKVVEDSILLDIVYSNLAPDYATYPRENGAIAEIYNTQGLYYSNINYIDKHMAETILDNGYYPYQLWSSDGSIGDNIALVKTNDSTLWRFGNLGVFGSQKNVDLALDFNNVQITQSLNFNGDGLISGIDTPISGNGGTLNLRGGVGSSGDITGGTGGTLNLQGGTGGEGTDLNGNGGDVIITSGITPNPTSPINAGNAGNIRLIASDAPNDTGTAPTGPIGLAGNVSINTGDGENNSYGVCGNGGDITIQTGRGGGGGSTVASSGNGGTITLLGGTPHDSGGHGGDGGDIVITGGGGSYGSEHTHGDGGNITLTPGLGNKVPPVNGHALGVDGKVYVNGKMTVYNDLFGADSNFDRVTSDSYITRYITLSPPRNVVHNYWLVNSNEDAVYILFGKVAATGASHTCIFSIDYAWGANGGNAASVVVNRFDMIKTLGTYYSLGYRYADPAAQDAGIWFTTWQNSWAASLQHRIRGFKIH